MTVSVWLSLRDSSQKFSLSLTLENNSVSGPTLFMELLDERTGIIYEGSSKLRKRLLSSSRKSRPEDLASLFTRLMRFSITPQPIPLKTGYSRGTASTVLGRGTKSRTGQSSP